MAIAVEAEERAWLERIAEACERVLAGEHGGDPTEHRYQALLEDVADLLARTKAKLAAAD